MYKKYHMIDCHTHFVYDNIKHDAEIDKLIDESFNKNVDYFFYASDRFEIFQNIMNKAEKFTCVKPVLGIYPDFAKKDDSYINKAIEFIEQNSEKISAIGEIGLDYHYEKTPTIVNRQKEVFIKFIQLAIKLNKPIVVHSRDAHQDTYDIIKQYCTSMKVYIHCYSSSVEFAKEFCKLPLDIYFGIGGVLTFNNSKVLKNVVSEIDIKHLVTETDSPYLAPTPYRSHMNKSFYINEVIKEIARIKQTPIEETYEQLYNNALNLFDI